MLLTWLKQHRLLFWRGLKYLSLVLILLLVVGMGGLYFVYSKTLPSTNEIMNWRASQSTRIYDRNGNVLYEIYGDEKRVEVASDELSPQLKKATIAIEDARFYEHRGVDPKGIMRAIVRDVHSRSYEEGGSTITQQLAKNAFLSSDRTLGRKIREALLAVRLERHFSKDQILTMYLNEVGYGGNAYGAEAASNIYFGKSAKDLTLAESATLAAITKSPTYYSPYGTHTKELTTRRDIVLNRMVRLGYASGQQVAAAKAEKLAIRPRQEKIAAPHFVMYVKQQLIQKYGEEVVDTGGLQVTTTLDSHAQAVAEDVIAHADPVLQKSNASNAGLVAIDPKTGQILAMVGSRNYFDAAKDGNVNITTSQRPPGSAFKPIVYAAAFEKGPWAPGSTLFDLQTDFGDAKLAYMPNNYDGKFHGPVSIREALANSYNIPAVKTEGLMGKDATLAAAKNVGINTFTQPERYGLSLAIGGGDVRLLELAGAYGSFANNGVFNAPVAITKVTQNGKTLFEAEPTPKTVFKPETAYEISSILSDAQARAPIFGTGGPLVVNGHNVAVKTGTSQDYRDALTVGYTPSLVAGVWVGNNDFHPMKQGSAGAMAAAPLWNSFMTQMLANKPDEPFVAPGTLQTVMVDAVTGQLPTSITRNIRQDIFAPWQMPTQPAQLANFRVYDCNNQLIGQHTAVVIHSEKPDNPNWEGPVVAWARANGYPTGRVSDVHEPCESTPPPTTLASQEPPEGVDGADINPNIVPTPSPSPAPISNEDRANLNSDLLPLNQRGRRGRDAIDPTDL